MQSIPSYSPSQIARTIKSLTARKIFLICPEVKQSLWGAELWTKGYFVNTVSKHGSENQIKKYIPNQGKKDDEYEELYRQGELF